MKTLVQEVLHTRIEAYNPAHSFVVISISDRRLCRYLAQIPGLSLNAKRDQITFQNVQFTFDNGGDTGGDGLWIMTKDGRPHPAELRTLREALSLIIDQHPPAKTKETAIWLLFIGLLLVCVIASFATLHTLTAFPLWASLTLAIPAGAALFYFGCQWAD